MKGNFNGGWLSSGIVDLFTSNVKIRASPQSLLVVNVFHDFTVLKCILCSFSLFLQCVTDERKTTVLTALQKQVIESTSVWCRHIHPSNRSYSVFGPAGDKQGNKPRPRPPVIFTGPVSSFSLSSLWTSLSPGGGVYMSCQFNSKMFFPWSRRNGANEEYEERK